MSFLSETYPEIIELLMFAQEQGEYAENLRHNSDLDIQKKKDGSLVTLADKSISEAAEEALPNIINVPVISEENPPSIEEYERFWLIDPIDGTSSYTGKYDGYAVAIALIDNGRPVMSVVVAPAQRIAYFATKEEGAFKIDLDNSKVSQLGYQYIGEKLFASFYKRSPLHEKKLQAFIDKNNMSSRQVYPESSLLKYCYAAEGRYAIAGGWSDLESWDIAAADLIVEESGGYMISAETQQTIQYSAKDSFTPSPIAVANGVLIHW